MIDRENVTLVGEGSATKLVLAPGQNINVIRGTASNLTIRDLSIEGNSADNSTPPDWEGAGILVASVPAAFTNPLRNILVERVTISNARTVGFQLIGSNVRVLNSAYYLTAPHTTHDAFELGLGPGELRGNYAEIRGEAGFVLGSDEGYQIKIADNNVNIAAGGSVTNAVIRPWPERWGNTVTNNIVRMQGEAGPVASMLKIEGGEAIIVSANVFGANGSRSTVYLRGAMGAVTGNAFQYIDVTIDGAVTWGSNTLMNSTCTKTATDGTPTTCP